MRLTEIEIFKLLDKLPKFQWFMADKQRKVIHFDNVEIGHPESIFIYKDKNGVCVILEVVRDYSVDKNRGHEISLGNGGEGYVRLARNVKTGQYLALKHTTSYKITTDKAYTFADEIQNQVDCIIKLHAYGLDENKRFYSVMDLGVRELAEQQKRFTLLEKISILKQIIGFTKKLAEHGYYYNDYKSRNILLDADLKVKVCDLEGFFTNTHHEPLAHYLIDMITFLYCKDIVGSGFYKLMSIVEKQLVAEFQKYKPEQAEQFYTELEQFLISKLEELEPLQDAVRTVLPVKSRVDKVGDYTQKHFDFASIDHLVSTLKASLANGSITETIKLFYQFFDQLKDAALFTPEDKATLVNDLVKLFLQTDPHDPTKTTLDSLILSAAKAKETQWLCDLSQKGIADGDTIIRTLYDHIDEDDMIQLIDILMENGLQQEDFIKHLLDNPSLLMKAMDGNKQKIANKLLIILGEKTLSAIDADIKTNHLQHAINTKAYWFIEAYINSSGIYAQNLIEKYFESVINSSNYEIARIFSRYTDIYRLAAQKEPNLFSMAISKGDKTMLSILLESVEPKYREAMIDDYFKKVIDSGNTEIANLFMTYFDVQKGLYSVTRHPSPLSIAIQNNNISMTTSMLASINYLNVNDSLIGALQNCNDQMLYLVLKHSDTAVLEKIFDVKQKAFAQWLTLKEPILYDCLLREIDSKTTSEEKKQILDKIMSDNSALKYIFSRHKGLAPFSLFMKEGNSTRLKISAKSQTMLQLEKLQTDLSGLASRPNITVNKTKQR